MEEYIRPGVIFEIHSENDWAMLKSALERHGIKWSNGHELNDFSPCKDLNFGVQGVRIDLDWRTDKKVLCRGTLQFYKQSDYANTHIFVRVFKDNTKKR